MEPPPLRTRSSTITWRNLALTFGAALVVSLIVFRLSVVGQLLNDYWLDVRMTALNAATPAPDTPILVTITEDTLSQFQYRSPIDRRFLADLVDALAAKGAKRIGLDILLDQPTVAENDAALVDAIRRHADILTLAWADETEGLTRQQAAYLNTVTPPQTRARVTLPKSAWDGIVRTPLHDTNADVPSFATAVSGVALERPLLLNYLVDSRGFPLHFTTFHAEDVAHLPASWFQDKLVLIGVDLPASDRHATPFTRTIGFTDASLPGVYLHALAIHQTLEAITFTAPPLWVQFALLSAGIAVGLVLACVSGSVLLNASFGLVLLAGCLALDVWMFREHRLLTSSIEPAAAAMLAFGVLSAILRVSEFRRRMFLRSAFSHYVAPSVIDRILADPDKLRLGGERRTVTFLFSDMAGFTGFCERYAPEVCTGIINRYTDLISDIVMSHGGTIEKYAGDGVTAFFGAPLADPDHTKKALAAAQEIDRQTESLRAALKAEGIDVGHTRIGIHCGDAILGNFGGQRRMQYSAVGDAINVAARLEALNKLIGTRLIFSDTVAAQTDETRAVPIGSVQLKGRTTLINVLTTVENQDVAHLYRSIFPLIDTDRDAAQTAFAEATESHPGVAVFEFHHQRMISGIFSTTIIADSK